MSASKYPVNWHTRLLPAGVDPNSLLTTATRGKANGTASLGSGGQVPPTQMPSVTQTLAAGSQVYTIAHKLGPSVKVSIREKITNIEIELPTISQSPEVVTVVFPSETVVDHIAVIRA